MRKVSVIIPTYHDWDRLNMCLGALENQTYPADFIEIIVVNNEPGDTPVLNNYPHNLVLINESKPGSYAARNAALRVATGDIVAFTDSDCIPDSRWIELAVKRLERGIESGVVRIAGGVELFFDTSRLTAVQCYEKIFAFDQLAGALLGVSVTANMITWRDSFFNVGFFNDSLMSGGDVEWGRRAHISGLKIEYAPEVVVKHPARASLSDLLQKRRRVSGGVFKMECCGSYFLFLKALVKGCFPSIYAVKKTMMTKGASLRELVVALLLFHYLKIYGVGYLIKLKLGIAEVERK